MSGILNVLITSFGGGPAPVGFFASITNPNGAEVSNLALGMKSDS